MTFLGIKNESEIKKEERDRVLAQFMMYAASDDCPVDECPRPSKNDDVWGCVKCIINYLRTEGVQK